MKGRHVRIKKTIYAWEDVRKEAYKRPVSVDLSEMKGRHVRIKKTIYAWEDVRKEAYKRPVSVDLSEMKGRHVRIKKTLSMGSEIPQWVVIALATLLPCKYTF